MESIEEPSEEYIMKAHWEEVNTKWKEVRINPIGDPSFPIYLHLKVPPEIYEWMQSKGYEE